MHFKLLFVFLLSLLFCAQGLRMKVTKSKKSKETGQEIGCKAGCSFMGILNEACYLLCMQA